ncbi:hypothetical protein BaRGS_00018307 [Batillaria attramentaria]|uniref:Uncharacterized protein n=1 Tax=Batillaria attramentaria TaxID=370345 RepID=A0ABD0KU06_9CAEN
MEDIAPRVSGNMVTDNHASDARHSIDKVGQTGYGTCRPHAVTLGYRLSGVQMPGLDIKATMIPQGKQDDRRRVKLCKEYKKIIRTLYPELNSRVYCVPPVHFNTVSYTPAQFSAATGGRGGARKGKTRAAEWHTQVDSRLEHVKADDAQHRTLRALKTLAADLLKEPVFILSNLKFKDYLNYTPNKQASQTVARLPRRSELDSTGRPRADHGTAGDKAAKGDKVEGDWDVLLFHRDHGIVLLEVKSVGEGQDPLTLELDKLGVREVEKGLRCCLCQDDLPARGATGDIPPETKTRLMNGGKTY